MPDTPMPDALPADLHYVDDTAPGITRRKLRGKFCYFDPSGERITDATEIQRINALAVPPAYTDVWICTDPRGHLQATGRDARGRKQYRYHPRWREVRDADKYSRMLEFGRTLPRLRKRLEDILAAPGFSRDKVMATVITLLDVTLIRVGNTQYARDNRSYGLTTLRNKHVAVNGSAIAFQFRGKSGIEHQITVKDRRLARIIRRCQEMPGQNLFQYLDENGERHAVTSSDVNAYLKTLTGADFTARITAPGRAARQPWRDCAHCNGKPKPRPSDTSPRWSGKSPGSWATRQPSVANATSIPPYWKASWAASCMNCPSLRVRKGLSAQEAALTMFLERMAHAVEAC